MGIFSRIFKIGQAKTNKLIDSLENPEEMLDQAIRDQDTAIREAKVSVRSVIATERETKALLDEENANQEIWEKKAETALKAGNEELATKALVRSEGHSVKAAELQTQWESQRAEVDKLKGSVRKMEDELSELRRNKEIIIAQYKSAQVKKKIYDVKAKIGKKSQTTDLIERMKAKARRASFEAMASEELADEEVGDKLENEFKDIEKDDVSQSVQEKLAAMKENMKN